MEALQKVERQELAVVPQPASRVAALIEAIAPAIKGGTDPAVVREQVAVMKDLMAMQAKESFDKSLADFQEECPPITKSKGVPTKSGAIAYRYSPFEEILAMVKPVMRKHGFSFTLDTDTTSADGWVIATCKLTHAQGHSETNRAKFPLGSKTDIMSNTQQYAAALTFASRRVFCNALGIVTVGEDFDGRERNKPAAARDPMASAKSQPTAPEPESPEQAKEAARLARKRLWELLEPVRGDANNWEIAVLWLRHEKILKPEEKLASLTAAEVDKIHAFASVRMEEMRGAR